MRTIVTGGAGFVGSHLVDHLINKGHHVTIIDNLSTGKPGNLNPHAIFYLEDVRDYDRIENLFQNVDLVFHLAALARIQPSLIDPRNTINVNVGGTLNVLELARQNNCQVIYAGSSSFHHGLYKSPYAWSKYGGEELCKMYSEVYNMNTSICRFYNVYGKRHLQEGTYATIIGIFEKQTQERQPLTITGDGEQRRDFTHVDDIVNGLFACVNKEFKAEIFELGRGINFSINEIANMFGGEKKYIPARKGEYDRTLCDYSKAKLTLDWQPKKDVEQYTKKWLGDHK